ncbi:hypothetical protein SBRY_30770 [Actinacidiphila bryophytorum]|uniref:Uncharacterized protein n=1 Tax=Actinacidiphila bryophytorum TaxID=1436133 RepID=A0A9W4MH95_9ACTN|nr:hypothetical protein SBRY_30770 [Actinacidiphila bryophytorum]
MAARSWRRGSGRSSRRTRPRRPWPWRRPPRPSTSCCRRAPGGNCSPTTSPRWCAVRPSTRPAPGPGSTGSTAPPSWSTAPGGVTSAFPFFDSSRTGTPRRSAHGFPPWASTRKSPSASPRPCFGSPACPATPGTHARCVVGVVRVGPLRGRPCALRSHAPDAAGPALWADGATSKTRPSPSPRPPGAPALPLATSPRAPACGGATARGTHRPARIVAAPQHVAPPFRVAGKGGSGGKIFATNRDGGAANCDVLGAYRNSAPAACGGSRGRCGGDGGDG